MPWGDVVVFHMDEYVGIGPDHPASFQRWIRERIAEPHPTPGGPLPRRAGRRRTRSATATPPSCAAHPLDLCCLGIGENGHLAFNDPPVADFADPLDVKIVELDAGCRRQQVGEGHFATDADVPRLAMTVTIPALLRAARVLAVVPEARKAVAVQAALEGAVTAACPASGPAADAPRHRLPRRRLGRPAPADRGRRGPRAPIRSERSGSVPPGQASVVEERVGDGAVPLVLAVEDVMGQAVGGAQMLVDPLDGLEGPVGGGHREQRVVPTRLDQQRPGRDQRAQVVVLHGAEHARRTWEPHMFQGTLWDSAHEEK